MKIKIFKVTIAMLAMIVIFFSCKKDETVEQKQQPATEISVKDAVYQRLIDEGFKKEDIVEYKDHYIVEGDIKILKNESLSAERKSPSGKVEQARTDYLVGDAYKNVKVYLNSGSFTSLNLDPILNSVVSEYNSLNAGLTLTRVYSPGEANIAIVSGSLPYGVCGQAGFPLSDGRPYNNVTISEATLTGYNLTSTPQLILLVAHEIGHCIGFRHTNWSIQGEPTAIQIQGTPNSDPSSFMNGASCGVNWTGFSSYDQIALSVLYPATPLPSNNKYKLNPGEVLHQNEYLKSEDNRFVFYMQADGNLVLYKYNQAIWASNTAGKPYINLCAMQGDGNLVLYDGNFKPYWASNTPNYPGSLLYLQNDGNVVIYQNGVARWATNTSRYQ